MDHRHEQLRNYIAQTRALCYDKPLQIKMKETCHNLLQIAEKDREQAEKLLKRLKFAYQAPKKTRRGLIDGLGTIAKTLFGTMDADDEKIIKEQLNLMQRNQQTLQHAMKNQIKILNATIAHVDNVEKVLQENEEQFLNITEKMRQAWIQTEVGYGQREDLDEHFIILNAIIKDLTNDLMDIIAHLTNAKKEIIDIRLLPIESILDNLKETASQIPQGTHFPFQISAENWRTIEKFLTISAYYDNTNIFTIIKIPLITYPEYEIIKAIPLPTHKFNNTFIFIEVNQPIIAIDVDSRTYFTPTENDLNKCVRNNDQYVCEQNYPVHYLDEGALCEVQAYVQLETYTNNCNIRHIHTNTTIWTALSNANSWLYSTRANQLIEITCENDVTRKIEIKRSGQITLKEKCKLTTQDVIIRTKKPAVITIVQTNLPDYNLTMIHDKRNEKILDKIRPIKLRKVIRNPTELRDLSERLDETNEDLNNNYFTTNEHVIYPVASSCTGIIIIIIITIIAIMYVKKKYKTDKKKLPETNINPMCKPKIIQEHIYGTASGSNRTAEIETDTAITNTAMLY